MTGHSWVVAASLAGAAVVAAAPMGCRARQRAVMGGPPARRRPPLSVPALDAVPLRGAVLTAAVAAGTAGCVLAGPVAGIALGAYGGLAVRGALRRRSARAATQRRARSLDGLCALAADLRAGVPAAAAWPSAGLADTSAPCVNGRGPDPEDRLTRLARAAWGMAEQTGAPLADLIERIEADARAVDRAAATAAAQAAGARATAWLLAGLPLGGIALGYGIGVDPLHVLLHTPIGAGCAVAAICLQLAGLAWADRLSRAAPQVA